MKQIAVLIPTFGRAARLPDLVKNFRDNSSEAELYFVVEPNDLDTLRALTDLKENFFMSAGEYVECINKGVAETKEPFVFCGADDIVFSPDWDKKLLKTMQDPSVNVTGGTDSWLCSTSGIHVSHPMIRRSYIDDEGGSFNTPGTLYYPGYHHYQCDIELEQVAHARDCFKLTEGVLIEHNHIVMETAEDDDTYKRSRLLLEADTDTYNKRKARFEWYDTLELHNGKAVPAPKRMKKLTVVMPIWNCREYVVKTLESLLINTHNPYELILIDDNSTEFDGGVLLKRLADLARQRFIKVKAFRNNEQRYCNYNWNFGVSQATGDYIAIINSDIEFQKNKWDGYLIEDLDFGYAVASPYQSDAQYYSKTPYQLPPPPDPQANMHLRGACFMISKKFAESIFPIPLNLIHWCGDSYISKRAASWIFDIRTSIFHHGSKSGAKVDQKVFWTMVSQDVDNWEALSGEEVTNLKNLCKERFDACAN